MYLCERTGPASLVRRFGFGFRLPQILTLRKFSLAVPPAATIFASMAAELSIVGVCLDFAKFVWDTCQGLAGATKTVQQILNTVQHICKILEEIRNTLNTRAKNKIPPGLESDARRNLQQIHDKASNVKATLEKITDLVYGQGLTHFTSSTIERVRKTILALKPESAAALHHKLHLDLTTLQMSLHLLQL